MRLNNGPNYHGYGYDLRAKLRTIYLGSDANPADIEDLHGILVSLSKLTNHLRFMHLYSKIYTIYNWASLVPRPHPKNRIYRFFGRVLGTRL